MDDVIFHIQSITHIKIAAGITASKYPNMTPQPTGSEGHTWYTVPDFSLALHREPGV